MPYSRLFLGLLPWYSVLVTSGIVAAIICCMLQEVKLGFPKDTTVDLALLVIPFGVIGARLYYVAFSWSDFSANPISILMVWNGGLAIYGGIIGGIAAIVVYARWKKLPFLRLCDMVIPGVALAQAIGRWGNFFNMEAYGLPITNPSLQFFPLAVLIPENGVNTWHMATFFYESVMNFCIFLYLWHGRYKRQHAGDGLLGYALLYGCARFVIEGFRMDSLTGGSIRVSQLLSLLMMLASLIILLRRTSPKALFAILLPTAAGIAAIATADRVTSTLYALGAVVWTIGCGVWCLGAKRKQG